MHRDQDEHQAKLPRANGQQHQRGGYNQQQRRPPANPEAAVQEQTPDAVVAVIEPYVTSEDLGRVQIRIDRVDPVRGQATEDMQVEPNKHYGRWDAGRQEGDPSGPVGTQQEIRGHRSRQRRVLGAQPAQRSQRNCETQSIVEACAVAAGGNQQSDDQSRCCRIFGVNLGGVDKRRRGQADAQCRSPADQPMAREPVGQHESQRHGDCRHQHQLDLGSEQSSQSEPRDHQY